MKRALVILFVSLSIIYFIDSYFEVSKDLNLKVENIVPDEIRVSFDSWEKLKAYFDEIGYDSIDNSPNIIVERFPDNFGEAPVEVRKELFVKIMIPIIRKINGEILNERREILEALESNNYDVLNFYMEKYNAKDVNDLLLKVDVIPEDLAVAQAAIESAWGTSRFAIEANNIFGEWTFLPGTGIIPKNRPEGATYEIEVFDNIVDSMRSYAMNLNKLSFYEDFRLIRAGKKKGHPADGLLSYSELGLEYVNMVKIVIKHLPLL
ncbi:MAG: glucosaminidase domain-containing protein [Thermosipho sp. (in: Bacteria)]|nr:glucosaminidase domain-containing protein [Thermosipho sp. (in: thermotogales)]